MNTDTWQPMLAALLGQRIHTPQSTWPASRVHRIEGSSTRAAESLEYRPSSRASADRPAPRTR